MVPIFADGQAATVNARATATPRGVLDGYHAVLRPVRSGKCTFINKRSGSVADDGGGLCLILNKNGAAVKVAGGKRVAEGKLKPSTIGTFGIPDARVVYVAQANPWITHIGQ